jgi:hypothetical protein
MVDEAETAAREAIEANARIGYAQLFNDNPRRGDGLLVLAHLAVEAGFYQVPNLAQWIKDTGSAAGYDLFCAEQNGRRSLFAHITRFAGLSADELVRLERLARFGSAGE